MVKELVPKLQAHKLQELQRYLKQQGSQLSNDKLKGKEYKVISCKGSRLGNDGHPNTALLHSSVGSFQLCRAQFVDNFYLCIY